MMDSVDEDLPIEYEEMLAEMMAEPIGELFRMSVSAEMTIERELRNHSGVSIPDRTAMDADEWNERVASLPGPLPEYILMCLVISDAIRIRCPGGANPGAL